MAVASHLMDRYGNCIDLFIFAQNFLVYFLKFRMTCRTITAFLCLFNHFHIESYKHMKCITVERNIEPYRERDSVEDMQPRLHTVVTGLPMSEGLKGLFTPK